MWQQTSRLRCCVQVADLVSGLFTCTDVVQGLNTSNAVTAFERMEEKVMALEAEAESTLQVRAPPLPGVLEAGFGVYGRVLSAWRRRSWRWRQRRSQFCRCAQNWPSFGLWAAEMG